MKPKTITLVIVCAVAMAGLLGPGRQPSSGQEQRAPTGRTTAHLLCCGRLVSVPGTWFGADRRCVEYLQNAPENVRTDACKYMKDSYFFSEVSCIRSMESICPEAKPPKCKERDFSEYGGPWFDPGAEGCQNLQDTLEEANWTREKGGTCTYTLSACGRVAAKFQANLVFIENGKLRLNNYAGVNPQELAALGVRPIRRSECKLSFFDDRQSRVPPQKVCCDIWQEAVRSGGSCNPEMDADCDGLPNDEDGGLMNSIPYCAPLNPNEEAEWRNPVDPRDFNPDDFDPRPPGLGWDELMPNEPCKLCKWVALSGKLTCSPDGRRDHEYKATWKCPTSGVERVVRKRVPARFPCTPPSRSRRTS